MRTARDKFKAAQLKALGAEDRFALRQLCSRREVGQPLHLSDGSFVVVTAEQADRLQYLHRSTGLSVSELMLES